jgi:hypothetical protein
MDRREGAAVMTKLQQIHSFKTDKAVADNIVESWLCVDCAKDTAPGFMSGPEMRIALALHSSVPLTLDTRAEVYHVKDDVWKAAGMRAWNGCLCIGCLEQRLGRELRPKDFARDDARCWARMPCTDRLLDCRGFRRMTFQTDDGEQEIIVAKRDAAEIERHIAPGETAIP